MHVQVSLKMEIAATASLSEMEQQIQQAGQQAMREALKQAVRQWEDQHPVCQQCGRSFCPAKSLFVELQGGTVTAPLQDAALLAGCSWPYQAASATLKRR